MRLRITIHFWCARISKFSNVLTTQPRLLLFIFRVIYRSMKYLRNLQLGRDFVNHCMSSIKGVAEGFWIGTEHENNNTNFLKSFSSISLRKATAAPTDLLTTSLFSSITANREMETSFKSCRNQRRTKLNSSSRRGARFYRSQRKVRLIVIMWHYLYKLDNCSKWQERMPVEGDESFVILDKHDDSFSNDWWNFKRSNKTTM